MQHRHLPFSVLALTFVVALLAPRGGAAQRPVELPPNAPQDKPIDSDECRWKALVKVTQPFVARAQASLPSALGRFQAGLPRGQTLFVTVRLSDSLGHREQVFVAVDSVTGQGIAGRIWNPVEMVRGYKLYQPYALRPADVIDWMISKSDGSEEGNEVGKFLDTYRPPPVCSDSSRAG